MFESALHTMRPRRRASVILSTSLHAALMSALVFPPMLRMPELGVDPPENLPILDTHILDHVQEEKPDTPRETPAPPRGTRSGGGPGAPSTPKKYVAAPPSGVIPELGQVAPTEDSCPECEVTFDPPATDVGIGNGPGTRGIPQGDPSAPRIIGPDVTPPVPVATPQPAYPAGPLAAHMEGVVILEAVIGSDGYVRDVRVLRGSNPLFDRAATDSVLKWRYEPARIGSTAVAVYLSVTIAFRISH